MGSQWDLPNHDRKRFEVLCKIVQDGKGHCSVIEQGRLVDYLGEFTSEVIDYAAEECMLNGWFRVGEIYLLAQTVKEFGIERTAWAIERMHGRKNHSIDTVRGILKGEIAAYRKPAGQKDEPMRPKAYKYPMGRIHSEATARSWLLTNGHPIDEWPKYFDKAGTDPELKVNLLSLKIDIPVS